MMTQQKRIVVSGQETTINNYVTSGRATLEQEIEGLEAVKAALDTEFVEAVELIAACRGRVIITGMGKSGHVARKIAATMASTGTPAHFVHPGEASHGDLGMICEEDVVIMLSNSGETAELEDMISYCKRFSIPLIALVRRAESMLVDAANVAIVLPEIPEASPTGAPTTSTIMMMAYGDAIAMALLERRGFTRDDFKLYHPGGKLGKGLLKVADLMHEGETLPLVDEHNPMKEVLVVMTARSMGCAGVTNKAGKLIGVVTDGDLRRHADSDFLSHTASEIMTSSPKTIAQNALAVEAVHDMNAFSITSLFVVEEGKPVGLIHIHDCLRAGVA